MIILFTAKCFECNDEGTTKKQKINIVQEATRQVVVSLLIFIFQEYQHGRVAFIMYREWTTRIRKKTSEINVT